MQTVTAIEIVDDPCLTYRHNHPNTNVVHIGVSRFLATARRLQNLKTSAPPAGAVDKVKIVDMRINPQLATCWRGIDAAHVTSTTDKQFGDEVTHKEVCFAMQCAFHSTQPPAATMDPTTHAGAWSHFPPSSLPLEKSRYKAPRYPIFGGPTDTLLFPHFPIPDIWIPHFQ